MNDFSKGIGTFIVKIFPQYSACKFQAIPNKVLYFFVKLFLIPEIYYMKFHFKTPF